MLKKRNGKDLVDCIGKVRKLLETKSYSLERIGIGWMARLLRVIRFLILSSNLSSKLNHYLECSVITIRSKLKINMILTYLRLCCPLRRKNRSHCTQSSSCYQPNSCNRYTSVTFQHASNNVRHSMATY